MSANSHKNGVIALALMDLLLAGVTCFSTVGGHQALKE